MRRQLHLFFTALMFYTRIPCPIIEDYNADSLNKATRYFPLVGWIVGFISFLAYAIAGFLFSPEIAVIISLVAGILTTGAFHEDGFADFFDGFGGGWTPEKILDIMKDSRVGTYGMVATICLLALKFFALLWIVNFLSDQSIFLLLLVFITYHAVARFTAIQLCFVLEYVRMDTQSKAKPIAQIMTITERAGTVIFGLSPLLLLSLYYQTVFLVLIPLFFLILFFKGYLKKWIGGYTGDCLGAVEQIAECLILLTFMTLWKYI